jgi:hypothetical protein
VTVQPDVTWLVSRRGTLSLWFRHYTQKEARFYRPRYFDLQGVQGYATRDRKLSAFYTDGLGSSYLYELPVGHADTVLVAGVRAAVTTFEYRAFVGLRHVIALETTALLSLQFR